MATWDEMPLTNKQFDQIVQQLAKVLVAASNGLNAAIERNTQAILTQTIETLKAQTGHVNATTSVQSIVESVEATFSRMAK
jgi:hypothetical protein